MTPVDVGGCLIPDAFDDAPLKDQVAMALRCAVENGASAREAERKRACLAEWVKAE